MSDLPLATRFTLGASLTDEQGAFLDRHGFLHFSRVATAHEVAMIVAETECIEQQWFAEGRTQVYGIQIGRAHV